MIGITLGNLAVCGCFFLSCPSHFEFAVLQNGFCWQKASCAVKPQLLLTDAALHTSGSV